MLMNTTKTTSRRQGREADNEGTEQKGLLASCENIVKPPGHRPGLPGKVISFHIVPLDPSLSGRGTFRPTNMGLSNAFLEKQGLVSIRTLWIQIHYPAKGPEPAEGGSLRTTLYFCASEGSPLGGDPHDGWCGEGRLITVPYPIRLCRMFTLG
jgi:hypothetical protein